MDTEPQRPRYDLRDMRARRSLRSVTLGRNNHELSNRVAREREVEAELERVGEAGLVVVGYLLGEPGPDSLTSRVVAHLIVCDRIRREARDHAVEIVHVHGQHEAEDWR